MGQSKQLRAPLPGRIRSDCWPTIMADKAPFFEDIPPHVRMELQRKRTSTRINAELIDQLDHDLLNAAKFGNEELALETAKKLHFKTTKKCEESIIPPAPIHLSDAWLSAVAEDHLPDIGAFGPEDCYAGLSHQAMAFRDLRLAMGSAMLFTPSLRNNLTAAGRFILQKPRPDPTIKASLWKWLRTPTALWRIHNNQCASPLLDMGKTPIEKVSALPNSPFMIARIVETESGFVASMAMPLPEIDAEAISKRITIAWLLSQRRSTKVEWLDLLRYRPDCVYNLSCRWAIENNRDKEFIQCWQSCYSHAAHQGN